MWLVGDVETKQNTTTFTVGGDIASQQNGNVWASENAVVSLSLDGTLNVFDPRDSSSWRKIHVRGIHAHSKQLLTTLCVNRDLQKRSPPQLCLSNPNLLSLPALSTALCELSACRLARRMLWKVNLERAKSLEWHRIEVLVMSGRRLGQTVKVWSDWTRSLSRELLPFRGHVWEALISSV